MAGWLAGICAVWFSTYMRATKQFSFPSSLFPSNSSFLLLLLLYQVYILLTATERNRFGASSLHQRDPRSALFENYHASPPPSSSRTGYYGYNNPPQAAAGGLGVPQGHGGYRPATPNSRYVSFLYWGEKGKEGGGRGWGKGDGIGGYGLIIFWW